MTSIYNTGKLTHAQRRKLSKEMAAQLWDICSGGMLSLDFIGKNGFRYDDFLPQVKTIMTPDSNLWMNLHDILTVFGMMYTLTESKRIPNFMAHNPVWMLSTCAQGVFNDIKKDGDITRIILHHEPYISEDDVLALSHIGHSKAAKAVAYSPVGKYAEPSSREIDVVVFHFETLDANHG